MVAIDHEGRRCDESCHDAVDPRCSCVCGGKLHQSSRKPGGVLGQIMVSGVTQVQLHFDFLQAKDSEEVPV